MIKKIQTSLALSENGAKGLVKGSLYNALYYMTLMLPMSILSLFLSDVLSTNESPERKSSPKCWCKFLCHNGYCYAAWFSNTSAEVLEKFWRAV